MSQIKDKISSFSKLFKEEANSSVLEIIFQNTHKLWLDNLKNISQVNFIMFCEAPPFDINGNISNYIYDKSGEANGMYLKAPYKALKGSVDVYPSKSEMIDYLNSKGFLFIDLLPLSINFSSKRNSKIYEDFVKYFWNGSEAEFHFSNFIVQNRLNDLKDIISSNVKVCFALRSIWKIVNSISDSNLKIGENIIDVSNETLVGLNLAGQPDVELIKSAFGIIKPKIKAMNISQEQINLFETKSNEAADSWNPVESYLELASEFFTISESHSNQAINCAEEHVEDISDAILIAEFFCKKESLNKIRANSCYEKVATLVEDTDDYISFAESVINYKNDKYWAHKLYRTALKEASFEDVMSLVDSAKEFFNNDPLIKDLFNRANELALNASSYHILHEELLEFSSESWANKILDNGHKVELVVEAHIITGHVAEFVEEESDVIRNYCADDQNQESIETLIPGPNSEGLLKEILEDEDFDLYDNTSESDLSMDGSFPVFNEFFKLYKKENNNLVEINYNTDNLKEDIVCVDDWKDEKKDEDAIAFSFGYMSNDIKLFEFSFYSRNEDVNTDMINLCIQTNEFFEINKYLIGIEYDDHSISYDETIDFEGEYFNGLFFNSKE